MWLNKYDKIPYKWFVVWYKKFDDVWIWTEYKIDENYMIFIRELWESCFFTYNGKHQYIYSTKKEVIKKCKELNNEFK